MNTGQMMLTIGAMILLSTLILRVNSNFSHNTSTIYNSKFGILATSFGNSVLEEASDKAFDEATVSGAVSSTAFLTNKNDLGPDKNESYPNFDDVDDYNGLVKIDSTLPGAPFKAVCTVVYVSPSNPDSKSVVSTWTKKISVVVTSTAMTDTIRLSQLYSYWVFR